MAERWKRSLFRALFEGLRDPVRNVRWHLDASHKGLPDGLTPPPLVPIIGAFGGVGRS